jgi:ABC-type glycerol-3-phosphate transport system substrate-binding protein
MRNGRRRLGMVGLLGVLALVAAACGGGGSTTTTPPAASGASGATGLPDLSGQSINVVAVWTGAPQDAFKQVLAKFDDETGANTTFTSAGSADLTTFLGTKIQGGNPPDVAMLPNPGLLTEFADQGNLTPIDDVAGDLVDANYAPIWRTLGTVDGKLYGVFFKAANKSTVWYNKHVFSDAGITPPATWPDLLKDAGTISDFGVTPFAIDGASAWALTDWFENIYIRTAGPDMYDKLTKHEIPWTDASVTTALKTLAQVWSHNDWIAGGSSGALQATFPQDVAKLFTPSITQPEAAIYVEGDFVGFEGITSTTDAKLGTDADFFDFPSIDGSPTSVVGGGDVAVLMKDTEGGKALVQFLASPEAGEVWAKIGGFTSPNKNVPASVYPDDITRRIAEGLINAGSNFRFDMSDLEPASFGGTTGQGEFKAFQDFLANPSDITGVQNELEASAKQAFASG